MSNVDLGKISDAIEALTKRVNEQAHAVGSKIHDAAGIGQQKLNQAKGFIEENPLLSVLGAVAGGWLLGRLFRSNKKD
jgi:hypothetical protein